MQFKDNKDLIPRMYKKFLETLGGKNLRGRKMENDITRQFRGQAYIIG